MTAEGWIGIILAILTVIVTVVITLGKIIHKQTMDRIEGIETRQHISEDRIHSALRALQSAMQAQFRSVGHRFNTWEQKCFHQHTKDKGDTDAS